MSDILKIKVLNPELEDLYKNPNHFHQGDSGFDLFTPEDVVVKLGETKFIDLQIQCEMTNSDSENIGYQLYPRSSISKTPLMLHNSVGIIDAGYRGNIKAAVRYIPTERDLLAITKTDSCNYPNYTIKKGTRLFQLCKFTGEPFKIKLVNELSDSSRGSGGFGSTGV